MTTSPAPATAKPGQGLAAAARILGIRAAEFKAAFADMDAQDKLDLTIGSYHVPVARRDAARQRSVAGQYARRGGCNLMGVEFVA